MNIEQFRYGDSNFGYLIYTKNEAAAVDGGAPEEILKFVRDRGLTLKYVTNTHDHWDHVPGNQTLLDKSGAEYISPVGLVDQKILQLGDEKVLITHTPGHTEDSLVMGSGGWLITGDTLFNCTVGNCYTRDYETYFSSLEKVLSFPPETKIYAGHDLFAYGVGVAKGIDPDNPFMTEYRKARKREPLYTTLEEELKVNPFIRFNDKSLDEYRKGLDMPLDTPYQRWRAMMTIH